jgi:cytochrome c oxidase assembly protein subunit 15
MWDNSTPMPQRYCFRLALFATILTFFVVIVGAYTRLTDAGLGCPDWPGCYGQMIVPSLETAKGLVIDTTKAWTEMFHRYIAGILGLTVFALSILSFKNRHVPKQPIILPRVLVMLVLFQALLGMWTVTLKLFPLVVMAHLLGGLTTLSLLWWLTLKLSIPQNTLPSMPHLHYLRCLAISSLVVLVVQILLGGWTSANYAALVCLNFPFCNEAPFSLQHFSTAFNLFSSGVPGSIGTPLDHTARITIHMVHRIGALVTSLVLGYLVFIVITKVKNKIIKTSGLIIALLLTMQILLGITNVLALLPLPIAVLHNGVGALLLLALVTLNYYLYAPPSLPYGKP